MNATPDLVETATKRRWTDDAATYALDACQRSLLFTDALRQRGDLYLEHRRAGKPPVLSFPYEILIDGRTLERPVNYALLRVLPEDDVRPDPKKRPYVIVDPRAGHGPGIGGSKPDSQVGIARRAGHPVYFVTFFPDPVPGQSLREVAQAEALFLEAIARRHPEAEGGPCLIGNCQAGWAVAALASMVPELAGPLVLNGAPLSYWSGVRGGHPMRYTGGLLGGKWLATLAGDLGDGLFDGAHLVANFEQLNPANTYWSKYYNLYSKVDTETSRFLGFEKWWGGFFLMNAEEMDAIVSQLFIGNKLARGEIVTREGLHVDLKEIESPIIVFASFGDNITPPQQALNWIVDLYGNDDAILEDNQVIVYLLHEDIGHLGIFVSGRVARKEHHELINTLDLIDRLPPGLYEMIIEKKPEDFDRDEPSPGDYDVRFGLRTIDDILALDDDREEEKMFQTVAAVSERTDEAYRTWLRPWVGVAISPWSAELLRWTHPLRMQRWACSSANPWLAPVAALAESARAERRPADETNPFFETEHAFSDALIFALDALRDWRDSWCEAWFQWLYGPFALGAVFPPTWSPSARPEPTDVPAELPQDLDERFERGGFTEAVARMFLAAVQSRRLIDRRSMIITRELRERGELGVVDPKVMKAIVTEQLALLKLDEDRALRALAVLLPTEAERRRAVELVQTALMIDPEELDHEHPLVRKLASILELDADLPAPVAGGTPPYGRPVRKTC